MFSIQTNGVLSPDWAFADVNIVKELHLVEDEDSNS
jgi:hypothetical protein